MLEEYVILKRKEYEKEIKGQEGAGPLIRDGDGKRRGYHIAIEGHNEGRLGSYVYGYDYNRGERFIAIGAPGQRMEDIVHHGQIEHFTKQTDVEKKIEMMERGRLMGLNTPTAVLASRNATSTDDYITDAVRRGGSARQAEIALQSNGHRISTQPSSGSITSGPDGRPVARVALSRLAAAFAAVTVAGTIANGEASAATIAKDVVTIGAGFVPGGQTALAAAGITGNDTVQTAKSEILGYIGGAVGGAVGAIGGPAGAAAGAQLGASIADGSLVEAGRQQLAENRRRDDVASYIRGLSPQEMEAAPPAIQGLRTTLDALVQAKENYASLSSDTRAGNVGRIGIAGRVVEQRYTNFIDHYQSVMEDADPDTRAITLAYLNDGMSKAKQNPHLEPSASAIAQHPVPRPPSAPGMS